MHFSWNIPGMSSNNGFIGVANVTRCHNSGCYEYPEYVIFIMNVLLCHFFSATSKQGKNEDSHVGKRGTQFTILEEEGGK